MTQEILDNIQQKYKEITVAVQQKMVIFAQKEDEVLLCFNLKDLEDITEKSNHFIEYLRSLKNN